MGMVPMMGVPGTECHELHKNHVQKSGFGAFQSSVGYPIAKHHSIAKVSGKKNGV